ncbi:cell adhesion molecule 3-like [Scyliorhinus canicula]|uniref:cell adhesion molecule 3-like n=1 Tax=Scyliorhinus canicula TaxID=7830 RepID=UPI0018F62113|nr:cell adhesion molecule 3-like [Scyliorhinus canicula]
MNSLARSLLFWHMSVTSLYSTGKIGCNAQLTKKVSGVLKGDVTITCKYAESIQATTLPPKATREISIVRLAEQHNLQWLHYKHDHKDAQVIIDTSIVHRCPTPSRYSNSMGSLHTAQLHIRGLLVSDAGFYFCVTVNSKLQREPDASQLVIKAVSISETWFLTSPMEANKPTILLLNVIGFYPNKIEVDWQLAKKQLQGNPVLLANPHCDGTFNATSMIAFVPQADDHDKTVTCHITHESAKVSMTLRLQVLYAPLPLTVQPQEDFAKMEGDLLELRCISKSNPVAKMSWILNGKVLLAKTTTHLRIRVVNVSLSDQGNYSCSAENSLGTRTSSVAVNVIGLQPGATDEQTWLAAGISIGVVLLLIIVTSVAAYAFVRKRRLAGRQAEEPVYVAPSQPTADVYETLNVADSQKPSTQKVHDAIYANTEQIGKL